MSERPRAIGPAPLDVRIVGILGLAVFVVIATLVSLSDSLTGGAGSFVKWATGLAVWIWAFLQLATSHIAIQGNDLVFVDVVIERAIPASAIAAVDWENGVSVRLTTGRTVESLAYGPSLLQSFVHFQRYQALAVAVERWLQATPEAPGSRGAVSVRWRLRRAAVPILVIATASSYTWMLVVWAFADPLRVLFGIHA